MLDPKHRISMSCPAVSIAAGNEFKAWVGYSLYDRDTFRLSSDPAEQQDYALCSGLYTEEYMARLTTPITEESRPAWGEELDLALAQQGQAMVALVIDETVPSTEGLLASAKATAMPTSLKGVATTTVEDAPAWAAGQDLKVGDLRTDDGITYMCIQEHTTQTDWSPAIVPALFVVIPADASIWQAGVTYYVGDVVTYEPNGFTYECRQEHTSQAGWTPPAVPALWLKI